MECAQCHDDPFGDTKQKDFFRLAAFTNGQQPMKQDLFRGIFQEMNALSRETTEHQAAWMFWRDVYGNSLAGGGTGRIALPHDYQYADGHPGDIEGARVPFGKTTALTGRRDRDDGRAKLAEWVFWLSSLSHDELPRTAFVTWDKLNHFAAFAVGGWLAASALRLPRPEAPAAGRIVLAVLLIAAFGALDEFVQL